MLLLQVPPCQVFADFIECYWYVDAGPAESSTQPDAILPTATSNLIFNLSGFPHREYSRTCDRFFELKTRWFSGIRDTAVIVGPSVCTKVIGVRFKTGGLLPFLRVSSSELAGLTIDPDALWGHACHYLHEELYDLSSVERKFELLETWLLQRFDPHLAHLGLLRSLCHLQERSGNLPIQKLACLADLSIRQYRRRFEQAVGLPPKRLARILRFQKLIREIGTSIDGQNWAGLACTCGYYDQAHLIAEFREFAEVTPTEYVQKKPVVPGFLPVDVPMSLFSNTAARAIG